MVEELEEIRRTIKERLLPKLPITVEEAGDKIHRIVFGTEHKDIGEAMLADLIDIVPFVGDASNIARISDAMKRGGKYMKRRVLAQAVDVIGGGLPEPASFLFDLFTPTNTLLFLGVDLERLRERFKLPKPPI